MSVLRLYQLRLADLEYKEGLGAVHAPVLRRCIAALVSRDDKKRIESRAQFAPGNLHKTSTLIVKSP